METKIRIKDNFKELKFPVFVYYENEKHREEFINILKNFDIRFATTTVNHIIVVLGYNKPEGWENVYFGQKPDFTTIEFLQEYFIRTIEKNTHITKAECPEESIVEYKVNIPIIKYVPYQLCPMCSGSGSVDSFDSTTSLYTPLCPVCSGRRIIPMHQIEES